MDILSAIKTIQDYCIGNKSFISLKKELRLLEDQIYEKTFLYGDKEVFRPIVENSEYKASSLGKIYRNGKALKPFICNSGYEVVSLSCGGKVKKYSVHRLIAQTFLDKRHKDFVVHHIDSNKTNNHVDNLSWVTHSENLKQARSLK